MDKALSRCVDFSRRIGEDSSLVLWGGGNSSVKTQTLDHTGKKISVLWVKASGFDMKTITEKGFAPLRLEELLLLQKRSAMTDEEMVAYQMKCLLEPSAPKPSIETLLHAFIPAAYVFHTHADVIGALTNMPNSPKVVAKALGPNVLWIAYHRPGFHLSKTVGEQVAKNKKASAVILDRHGAITWGASAEEAYGRMRALVGRAQYFISKNSRGKALRHGPLARGEGARVSPKTLLPILRGELSSAKKVILCWDKSPEVLSFLNHPRLESLISRGPFSPDHIMQTRAWPLVVRLTQSGNESAVKGSVKKAFQDYRRMYKATLKAAKPDLQESNFDPRVILIPGFGMVTTGKDLNQAKIPQEIYKHTIKAILQAEGFSRYQPLSARELLDVEYWPMEVVKRKLLPPEKEFSGHVVLVTGAAGGIGSSLAEEFCLEGAHVVLTDIDPKRLKVLEGSLNERFGDGRCFALVMDISKEASVIQGFDSVVSRFGGLDVLVSNAGVSYSAAVDKLGLDEWERNFKINSTGHFLVCREAVKIFKRQGRGGNVVVIASKNVLAPGKEFAAYSASKAAQTQLARVLALEGGQYGIRVNMINPDAVFNGSGLWSQEVRRARAKAQGISPDKLEAFYVDRNLLKTRILPQDVSRSAVFLASSKSAKTTGAIIPVDGGLREAFPR